jgi:hypothetical protein
MKTLKIVMIGVYLASAAIAQEISTTSVPPDIEVLKKSWHREIINPALGVDPFKANREHNEEVQTQKKIDEYNKKKPAGATQMPPKATMSQPSQSRSSGLIERFYYQAKIKNIGNKTIKSITWEYVFFDIETKVEISRFQCEDKRKINPGKSADLLMNSPTPPASILDIKKADKGQQLFIEQFVIARIEYSDGSVWQNPQN